MNFEEKTKNQGTSKPEASHSENGDIGAWACCEELVELDDVQLATVVGAAGRPTVGGGAGGGRGGGAWACGEELVELDDVQLATVVGAAGRPTVEVGAGGGPVVRRNVFLYILGRWGEEEE